MKIQTSELTIGLPIDWVVAQCEKLNPVISKHHITEELCLYPRLPTGVVAGYAYSPSTNWGQGGEIMKREKISADPQFAFGMLYSWTCKNHSLNPQGVGDDVDQLVAAMKCYISSIIGETIEIPDAIWEILNRK